MKWCHSATAAELMKAQRVGAIDALLTFEGEPLTIHDAMPRDGIVRDDGDPIVERVKRIIVERRAKDELIRRHMLSQWL